MDLREERHIIRRAQAYTISVYPHELKRLCDQGATYEVKTGTGVYCLHAEYYDDEFGVRPEAGALEELIV